LAADVGDDIEQSADVNAFPQKYNSKTRKVEINFVKSEIRLA
jgi:hypothetical protein